MAAAHSKSDKADLDKGVRFVGVVVEASHSNEQGLPLGLGGGACHLDPPLELEVWDLLAEPLHQGRHKVITLCKDLHLSRTGRVVGDLL